MVMEPTTDWRIAPRLTFHTRRRTLLRAGLGALVLGVTACQGNESATVQSPHPLEPIVLGTDMLVTQYTAVLSAHPDLSQRLEPLLANHHAHLTELRRVAPSVVLPSGSSVGASIPPSTSETLAPSPTDAATALQELRAAEEEGVRAARAACLADEGVYAPLLGSIAACRVTHLEALA